MTRTEAERARDTRARIKADPARHEAQRTGARRRHLGRKYGITHEQYEAMLAAQGGVCACCGTSESGRDKWLVDHDHTTGRVRGLLCFNCNIGIGKLGDDEAGILRALAYMQRPND